MSGLDDQDDLDLKLAIQLSLQDAQPAPKPKTEQDWQDLAFFTDAPITREDNKNANPPSVESTPLPAQNSLPKSDQSQPPPPPHAPRSISNERRHGLFGSLSRFLSPAEPSSSSDSQRPTTSTSGTLHASNNSNNSSSGPRCPKCSQSVSSSIFSAMSTVSTGSGETYHAHCFVCGSCGGQILGPYAIHSSSSTPFHPGCFRCAGCNGVIDGPFSDVGEPKQPYHPACAKELFAPRCCLCAHPLEGRFYRHSYFEDEKYCLSHESRTTCFACGRREPLPESRREGFVDLMDGRALCGQCSSTIIVDAGEAVALYRSIVEFMGGALGLTIPAEMRDVPILVVDVHSLNENMNKQGASLGYHDPSRDANINQGAGGSGSGTSVHLPPGATVRGVTLSTCSEVRHFGGAGWQDIAHAMQTGRAPAVFRTSEKRDVTAVLVLYGLPRDLTASILAHEAMHVWLKLHRGFPFRMPPKLEEGLCQVIAYLYLESLVENDAASAMAGTADRGVEAEQALRKYFSKQIKEDPSPVYGEGFRDAYRVVQLLGLDETLAYIRENHALPPI